MSAAERLHQLLLFEFRQRGAEVQVAPQPQRGRDGREEVLDALRADDIEHGAALGVGVGEVAHGG